MASCHKVEEVVALASGYTIGVATISTLLQMIGLFCKRALSKRRYSAKETYNFKESTHRSHPISSGPSFVRDFDTATHSLLLSET